MAFTLVEVLAVLGIMIFATALASFSLGKFNAASNLGGAISDFAGAFEQARNYAMASNTYVFAGIAEMDASLPDSAATISGTGRVVVSIVASRDGTKCYNDITGTGWVGDSTRLVQVGKPIRIENLHLAEISERSGNLTRPVADCVLTSDGSSILPFTYPLSPASARYRFVTIVQFSPQGSASFVQASDPARIPKLIEIGLAQTRGSRMVTAPAAGVIQLDGLTGALRIFRP